MRSGLLAFFFALLGCSTEDTGDSSTAQAEPTLSLVSPVEGDTVCGNPFVVVTDIQNFTLTNETIEDPPPNTGHLHVYLNGQEVAQADTETVEVTDVAAAEYQLSVDLALADHSALDPYIGVTVYITIDNSLCMD